MNTTLALLDHHIARAQHGVAYNALRNCHAMGLESIVLHDEPGNRIRMFVAHAGHTLWANHPGQRFTFSVGLHAHHCAIRLVPLFGDTENHNYAVIPHPMGDFHAYTYSSGVTGSPSMEPTGQRAFAHCIRQNALRAGAIALPAHLLHTIYLRRQLRAAWLVIEGKEDPYYRPVCWSNADTFDFDPLYQPMDGGDVVETLEMVRREVAA